jgi:glycosyl transferase family 25
MRVKMMQQTSFAQYFDRVYIINLPSRVDRLTSILRELDRLGFDEARARIFVPDAPVPCESNEFPSKGVYGNFLSHLGILREARQLKANRTLVLEDDAIFLRSIRDAGAQSRIIAEIESYNWSMWFVGHRLRKELSGKTRGIFPTTLPFSWAHCYAVHMRSLADLVSYLESVLERPPGHPEGGRMYIDGAFSMFRALYPKHICLISNPALSIQKGTSSNLGKQRRYDSLRLLRPLAYQARAARDEFWRWTGVDFRKSHAKNLAPHSRKAMEKIEA